MKASLKNITLIKSQTCLLVVLLFALLQFDCKSEATPQKSNKQYKSFSASKWKSLKEKIDYSGDKLKEEKKKEQKPQRNFSFNAPFAIGSGFIKIVLFVLAGAALIFILLKLFNKPSDLEIEATNPTVNFENITEAVLESDLERHLRKAKDENNYKLVIRIYYLIIIKELSGKRLITWKKDKTNAEYVRELGAKSSTNTFKELTLIFEWVWYSEYQISENQYHAISNRFEGYIKGLKG